MFVQKYPPVKLVSLLQTLEKDFPDDLVLNINSMGRLSTNYDKPYILFSPLDSNPQPLIVIDTKANKDKIFEYNAHALLAERYMVVRMDNHVYTLHYELNEPLRVDKSDVMSISQNAQLILESYWVWVVALIVGFLLIAPPVLFVTQILTLLIVSLVSYIFVRMIVRRSSCTYAKVFQISLHTTTAPLLIQSFLFLSGHSVSIPYWYMILTYLFLAGGIYEAYFERVKHSS